MTKKGIQALETASIDFFRNGKTETICPRCGKPIRGHVSGNSYMVACETKDCIENVFRRI